MEDHYIQLLLIPVGLSIALVAMFFLYAFRTGVLARFGRTALSWRALFSLSLCSFIPMIGLFSSLNLIEEYKSIHISHAIILNVGIGMIADQFYNFLSQFITN